MCIRDSHQPYDVQEMPKVYSETRCKGREKQRCEKLGYSKYDYQKKQIIFEMTIDKTVPSSTKQSVLIFHRLYG